MTLTNFRLHPPGIRQVLKGAEVREVIDELAEETATAVRQAVGPDVPVVVDHYTTDRDAAAVVIADPTGMLLQARDGVLTRAAGAVGLEVRSK